MKRYEKLSGEDAASQHQYEAERLAYINAETEYQLAKKQYDDSYIKAPCNGMLTGKYIETGSYVTPGTETFEIVDLSRMKFMINLTADEVNGLTKNEEVEITADNYPGEIFTGKIKSIVVKADESKRYEVEVELGALNIERKLKPGMYGTAMFKQKTFHNSLVIKRKALTGSIENPEVFVISGNTVSSRKITAEPIDDKYLEVKSGLKEGELVVISGQINLKNESKIKIN
jgi:RND family efflux transporter MFP subunit